MEFAVVGDDILLLAVVVDVMVVLYSKDYKY